MKHLKIKKLTLVVLFCGLFAFSAQAQEAHRTDTLSLSLADALKIAMSESPDVRIADREIRRVDYSRQSAWNNVFPSLSASGQFAYFAVPGEMSMMGQVMNSPTSSNTTVGLNLGVPIFAPALWNMIRMTELDLRMAHEQAHSSRVQLRSAVTKAFYAVMLAQDVHSSLLNTLEFMTEIHHQAQTRFELGLGSEFDAISAEVQMMSLKPNILDVENNIAQLKKMLKIVIGLDIDQPIAIAGSLADYEEDMQNANLILNMSLDNNSDLRQLSIAEQQLQRALALQRTQRMPTLAGFATYGYTGMGTRATDINFGGMPIHIEQSHDWFSQGLIVGVQLSVPISGIITNRSNERQTRMQIEKLNIQREFLEQHINVQVQTALNNMNTAIHQAEVAQKNQELAQRAYDISARRFEIGAGSFLETQNALLQLSQAEITLHQAIANFLNARAEMERLLGESGF